MKIIDLTSLLNENRHNYHCFNGALVQHTNDTYIFVYRIAKYNLPISYHPWKIWDSAYKNFPNSEKVIKNKYRNYFGDSYMISINNENKIPVLDEYDSTGLAILKYIDDSFKIINNINNIFNKEMNQDVRIIRLADNKYKLSYNTYENFGPYKYVKMKTREMKLEKDYINLSKETEMFQNKKYVEKNCVYDYNGNILYEIYPEFTILTTEGTIKTESSQLKKLVNYYGSSNIYASISSPPIKFNNYYLAVSHVKIKYKIVKDIYPFKYFYDTIDFNKICPHGNYIYFILFYLYDDNYKIIKVSNPFIPQLGMCHLPWLLTFAMNIIKVENEYIISYGEGDCRCKLLYLTEELSNLLIDEFDLGFYFLTDTKKILHYGYYKELNCGDDMFMTVFKYLHKKYYPNFEISFEKDCSKKTDQIIIGGGDVINSYFIEPLKKYINSNTIAVSVGIPYLEKKEYLNLFKHITIRNKRDYHNMKKYYNLSYYPDLGFLLPKIYGVNNRKITQIKHIGFCLTQTFYKKGYENEYENFVTNICISIKYLLTDGYIVHLIPFCIQQKKNEENDLIIINIIKSRIPDKNIIIEYDETYTKETYIQLIYQKISQMDFNVCTRFHSHIFSMIHRVPFISLSCSRKCIEFMNDIELTNNLYKLETNDIDLPINFDGHSFHKFLKEKFNNLNNIIKKLNHFMTEFESLMINFEKYWKKIIYHSDKPIKIHLFPNIKNFNINDISSPPIYTSNPSSPPLFYDNNNYLISKLKDNNKIVEKPSEKTDQKQFDKPDLKQIKKFNFKQIDKSNNIQIDKSKQTNIYENYTKDELFDKSNLSNYIDSIIINKFNNLQLMMDNQINNKSNQIPMESKQPIIIGSINSSFKENKSKDELNQYLPIVKQMYTNNIPNVTYQLTESSNSNIQQYSNIPIYNSIKTIPIQSIQIQQIPIQQVQMQQFPIQQVQMQQFPIQQVAMQAVPMQPISLQQIQAVPLQQMQQVSMQAVPLQEMQQVLMQAIPMQQMQTVPVQQMQQVSMQAIPMQQMQTVPIQSNYLQTSYGTQNIIQPQAVLTQQLINVPQIVPNIQTINTSPNYPTVYQISNSDQNLNLNQNLNLSEYNSNLLNIVQLNGNLLDITS